MVRCVLDDGAIGNCFCVMECGETIGNKAAVKMIGCTTYRTADAGRVKELMHGRVGTVRRGVVAKMTGRTTR